MGQFTNAGKNNMLNASGITHVALFNGNPGSGGTELSGGSPAYARKAVTLPSASDGQIVAGDDLLFDVPAGSTVSYVAYYNALTGGTLLGYDDVPSEVYAGQGQYLLDSTTLTI